MRYILTTIVTLLLSLLLMANTKVVFRLDDVWMRPDAWQDSILVIFERNNVPLNIGVVPFFPQERTKNNSGNLFIPQRDCKASDIVCDSTYLQYLRHGVECGNFELSLHGYSHTKHIGGEFAGIPYEQQEKWIREGKNILNALFDTDVYAFIPPWNEYDENTLKALQENEITIISAWMANDVFCKEMSFVPACTHPNVTIGGNIQDIAHSIVASPLGGASVVMMHPFDFATQTRLDSLEMALQEWLAQGIEFVTFRELVDEQIMTPIAIKAQQKLHRCLLLKYLQPQTVFLSIEELTLWRWINMLLYIGLFLLLSTGVSLFTHTHTHGAAFFARFTNSGKCVYRLCRMVVLAATVSRSIDSWNCRNANRYSI